MRIGLCGIILDALQYINLSLFIYKRMSTGKRSRNSLRESSQQRRYSAISQTGYYGGTQPSVSASDKKKRAKVMKNNVALSRQLIYSPSLRMDTLVRGPMSPEMERKSRRRNW